MGAAALMMLPIGVPKVVLSPIASGRHEFGPLVGTSDMMVVHTVVDIMGLNPVATTVFDNVATAVAAMAVDSSRLESHGPDSRLVGVTMLGNTTIAVMALRDRLAEHGYEAVVFHSNGVGGPAMEELAEAGLFMGVIDFTTNEVTDPMVGGIHDGGPRQAARRSPSSEFRKSWSLGASTSASLRVARSPRSSPAAPSTTTTPSTPSSAHRPARWPRSGSYLPSDLNRATGPLAIAIPTRGTVDTQRARRCLLGSRRRRRVCQQPEKRSPPDIAVNTFDHHVNDPRFGEIVADLFADLLEVAASRPRLEKAT